MFIILVLDLCGKRPFQGLITWRIILKLHFRKIDCEDVKCIELAQDKIKLRTFLNMVMKL